MRASKKEPPIIEDQANILFLAQKIQVSVTGWVGIDDGGQVP
jgi:hypothetical protein